MCCCLHITLKVVHINADKFCTELVWNIKHRWTNEGFKQASKDLERNNKICKGTHHHKRKTDMEAQQLSIALSKITASKGSTELMIWLQRMLDGTKIHIRCMTLQHMTPVDWIAGVTYSSTQQTAWYCF